MNDLSFRVLGPVEVLRGGKPCGVPGGITRSLLAGLLVAPDQTAAATELVRLIRDEPGPANPGAALQSAAFRLRRVLGRDAVETVAGGYRLRARPEAVDLLEFRRRADAAAAAAARGADEAAAEQLDEALGLWRLPVLSNVSSAVLLRDAAPPADRPVPGRPRGTRSALAAPGLAPARRGRAAGAGRRVPVPGTARGRPDGGAVPPRPADGRARGLRQAAP